MRLLRAPVICLALLVGTTAAAHAARLETVTAELGDVRAELSYRAARDYGYTGFRLAIARGGQTLLEGPLPTFAPKGEFPASDQPLAVRDLEGDGEAEVVVDLYTGGAHCCTYSVLYRYDPAGGRYTSLRQDWGNVGYALKDLDGDGLSEFESADDRFAYVFTAYVGSVFPPRIWQYREGRLSDITRRYPKLAAKQAASLAPRKVSTRDPLGVAKARLAAYLADKYLIGEGQDGWRQVRLGYQALDRERYFRKLTRLLRRTGYTPR